MFPSKIAFQRVVYGIQFFYRDRYHTPFLFLVVNPFSPPTPTWLSTGRNTLPQGGKIAPRPDPGIFAGCRRRHEHHQRRGLCACVYVYGPKFLPFFTLMIHHVERLINFRAHNLTRAGRQLFLDNPLASFLGLARVCIMFCSMGEHDEIGCLTLQSVNSLVCPQFCSAAQLVGKDALNEIHAPVVVLASGKKNPLGSKSEVSKER